MDDGIAVKRGQRRGHIAAHMHFRIEVRTVFEAVQRGFQIVADDA